MQPANAMYLLSTTDVGGRVPKQAEEDEQNKLPGRTEQAVSCRNCKDPCGHLHHHQCCRIASLLSDLHSANLYQWRVTLHETKVPLDFFFCLIILAFDLSRSWRRTFCPVSLSAVRAVAARCKLPFALRPGLSQERVN